MPLMRKSNGTGLSVARIVLTRLERAYRRKSRPVSPGHAQKPNRLTGVHEDWAGSLRECYIGLRSRKLHPYLGMRLNMLGGHYGATETFVSVTRFCETL